MNKKIYKLSLSALMIALCYVSFTYLRINIPTPLGFTSFHLGNTFCVLASLMLGGVIGGLAGAIGMGIGDILDPIYVAIAPKTIILKMCIGLVTGFFAHKVFKIKNKENKALGTFVSSTMGMLVNIIMEPCFGYFYYKYVLLAPDKALKALTSFNLLSTSINAVIAIILASTLYLLISKRININEK